jgi:hypothetical protein
MTPGHPSSTVKDLRVEIVALGSVASETAWKRVVIAFGVISAELADALAGA